MSDYHVLSQSGDGNKLSLIMHVAVPAGTNSAGRDHYAVVQAIRGEQISAYPFISAAEQTQLTDGELWELSGDISTYPDESAADKQAKMDAYFTARSAALLAELNYRLEWYGYDRDVP